MTEYKIKKNKCMFCGEKFTNMHHVIPKSFKPKDNVLIPLCDKHKDILHVLVKQIYLPKEIRIKINKIKQMTENLNRCVESLKNNTKFQKSTKIIHDSYLSFGEIDNLNGQL